MLGVLTMVVLFIVQDSTVVEVAAESNPLFDQLMTVVAIGVSALLGAVKGWLKLSQAAWFQYVKPLQPVLVYLGGLGVVWLLAQFGITIASESAAFATLVAITVREIAGKQVSQKIGL